MKINVKKLAISIVICLLVGVIGSFFTTSSIANWYTTLNKPNFSPPNWLFGPVWTALYTIMAVAVWLVWKRGGFAGQRVALLLFLLQLLFNALWSPLFFGLRDPALAFTDIVLLWLALLGTVAAFWKVHPLSPIADE